jgi:anti-sigma B factor antagonist
MEHPVEHIEGFRAKFDPGPPPRVVAAGEIDVRSAPRLAAVIDRALAADPAPLTVDMSEVSFIDAAGLRVLDSADRQRAAGGSQHRLRVTGATSFVAKVFRVAEMGALLEG